MDISGFLETSRIPVRLSVEHRGGSLIVPLWFLHRDEALWCASHARSLVVAALTANPQCAFDVSTNDMPYRGIRGRATAACHPSLGASVLTELIDRYLPDRTNRLAAWLLARADEEVAIELRLRSVTDWDFSERMSDLG